MPVHIRMRGPGSHVHLSRVASVIKTKAFRVLYLELASSAKGKARPARNHIILYHKAVGTQPTPNASLSGFRLCAQRDLSRLDPLQLARLS